MTAAISIAVPHDTIGIGFLTNGAIAAILIAMMFAAACRSDRTRMRKATTSIVGRLKTQTRGTHRKLVVALCGASASLTLVWRIFNDASDYAMTDHFDAFFYSVVQTVYGGTCLGNAHPQYGCYGEIVAPLLQVVGLSVFTIAAVMAVLSVTISSFHPDFRDGPPSPSACIASRRWQSGSLARCPPMSR